LNNPNFKPLEFEGFKKRAGLNSFVLKWYRYSGHREGENFYAMTIVDVSVGKNGGKK